MAGINFKYSKAIFMLFIIVLGIIIYTSVFNSDFGNINITGDFLNSGTNPNQSSDVNIKANLTNISLELDGVFKEISFTSAGMNKIKIEKSFVSLNDSSKIVLKDYNGEMVFGHEKIESLDGDTDRIVLDGGRVFYEEESDVELSDFDYKNMKIEGVYIRKFEKLVSGFLKVDNIQSSLENNELLIKKFEGTISSEGLNESVNLVGKAQGVKSKNIKAGSTGLFS